MKIKALFPKRRDGSFGSVTVEVDGKRTVLPIGADGTVDVPDEKQAARLVNIGNFAYADGSPPKGDGAMLIANGDESIDLMEMDRDALLVLAGEVGIAVHPNIGEAKLRVKIYEHIQGKE